MNVFASQGHIETLKAQLESHKGKANSFDQIQEQLENILSEKNSLEMACKRFQEEKDALEAKLSDQQVRVIPWKPNTFC